MLFFFSILCSFATTCIFLLCLLFIFTNNCYHFFSLSFCQNHHQLLLPFAFSFVHLQLLLLSFYLSLAMLLFLLTLVHIQSNPSLFFVIIFYLIEHQTPYTHLFNFNYVSEIIGGMLQLPSSLHLSLGSLLGLFMSRCC